MDINNKIVLLEELQEFLNSRKVNYIAISRLLDKIATVQTDSEKLLILKSEGVQRQLQEGMGSLNDLCISKLK
jgi:predicted house-cleaning noncanonical NTP pyrophosphatase (MazG superfamily)